MSSLRFPVIDTKKNITEEEDYNFVNKDKKKKLSSNNPLELIQELKRKIEEQRKQIENRNMTIQGLQRNFESLSVIVKNEKAQSALLRSQLQNLKGNASNGDRRAAQFHQKCILLQRELKEVKQELKQARKAHSECGHTSSLLQQSKRQNRQLEEANQKLHQRIIQHDNEKKSLQAQVSRLRQTEKEKRLLNERIIDLEEQVKRLTDISNGMKDGRVGLQEQLKRAKEETQSIYRKGEEMKYKLKDVEKRNQRMQFDNDFLKKQIARLTELLEKNHAMIANKEMYDKIKTEEEGKMRQEIARMRQQLRDTMQALSRIQEESKEKTGMLDYAHDEVARLKDSQAQLRVQFQAKEGQYKAEIYKLTGALDQLHSHLNMTTGESSALSKQLQEQMRQNSSHHEQISSLHSNIDEMNRKMAQHHAKYGRYLAEISQNEPDVVITNSRELQKMENGAQEVIMKLKGDIRALNQAKQQLESNTKCQENNIENMRKYIKNLQEEVSTKSEVILEKNKLLRKFEDQEEELNRMIAKERRLSEQTRQDAENKIKERLSQLQNQKLKSRKEIEDERRRLEAQLLNQKAQNEQKLRSEREQSEKYSKLLENYKAEQAKLKEMMSKEQQDIQRLQRQKQEEIRQLIKDKQAQLEREKRNNKALWSDNKKLKDLQAQLKEQSRTVIQEKQAAKKDQIQRLKRELQKKYKEEMSSIKNQESNSHELKKILAERTAQFRQLSESHHKLKSESQFYKNRNKELEALVSRMQKQQKQATVDLQRENKSSKQVIDVLQKKLREAESNISESEKRQKRQLKYLYDEIDDMKKQAKNARVQEKLALVSKSMADLETSLKTLMNTMSCNYCVEVVKDCVRLQCGHIYCKKCKGGYEPNCGQCKKKSNPAGDKIIDQSVSRAQYMKILVGTIQDDLHKISLK